MVSIVNIFGGRVSGMYYKSIWELPAAYLYTQQGCLIRKYEYSKDIDRSQVLKFMSDFTKMSLEGSYYDKSVRGTLSIRLIAEQGGGGRGVTGLCFVQIQSSRSPSKMKKVVDRLHTSFLLRPLYVHAQLEPVWRFCELIQKFLSVMCL